MKCSRSDVRKKAHALPDLKFESQTLTSFAGLVIFQKFFMVIDLKTRLSRCFRHVNGGISRKLEAYATEKSDSYFSNGAKRI